MNSLLLSYYEKSGTLWLTAALIIVAVLLIITTISAIISRIVVFSKYNKLNNDENVLGHTAFSACRNLLDKNGMSDVKIKMNNIFRTILYGNNYSKLTKTIYLNKNIINETSVIAVGIASQKVGLAIQDKEKNNTAFKIWGILSPIAIFSPFIALPLTTFGIIFDLLFNLSGAISIVALVLSFLIFGIIFIYTLLTIPIESRANKLAYQLMEKTKILDENERTIVKDFYSKLLISYFLEFIVALLQILKVVFQIILKVKSN